MPPHEFGGDRSDSVTGHFGLKLDGVDEIRLTLIRLEGKLDAALRVQSVKDEVVTSTQQQHATKIQTLEERLRAVELRRYVEPRTVWTAFGLLVTVGGFIVALINSITKP